MTRSANPPLTRSRAATLSSMTVGRTTSTPGSGPSEAKLTVIVPVYDEAATIDELLRRVLAAPYAKQVIVVDDGSTDRTPQILEAWQGHPQVELLKHSRNRGKGAAIRTGLEQAQGLFTIIQDADLECDPEDYPLVIEPLLAGRSQVVYGSRYRHHNGKPRPHWSMLRCGVIVLNLCVRLLYGARLTDEAACYKVFPTELLKSMDLQCQRFEFCPEVTAKACRMGLSIHEVAVGYRPRSGREGKKLRWRDGPKAILTLWRWRRWRPVDSPVDDAVAQIGGTSHRP